MARHRIRKRPISQINVVPYIDVMLVLLVIFMITAPLLKEGVKVELPRAGAEPLPAGGARPLIVSIDREGRYFVEPGPAAPLAPAALQTRVAAWRRLHPGTPVLVRGDARVAYGQVVAAMALLQQAGVADVGLMTRPPRAGEVP